MYSMSRVASHNPVPFWFDHLFNLVSNLTIRYTGFTYGNSLVHGLFGRGHEIGRFLIHLAYRVCRVDIAVKTSAV